MTSETVGVSNSIKKRGSKWDVVTKDEDTTPTGAAAVAAAKINAMLAAKGKLAKQVLPPKTPTPALGTSAASIFPVRTPLLTPPLTPYPMPPPPAHGHIQEKLFVGLEEAPRSFGVTDRLKGPDNTYLNHILSQTGGKAFLRGRGSGFIEPTSGKESFEALHVFISHSTQDGVNNARKLCQSLIDTVKKDYEAFKLSQAGPLGFGGTPGYATTNPARPSINPYSLHLPGYHGYGVPPPSQGPYYESAQGPPGYYPPVGPGYPPPGSGYYGPLPPCPYPPPHMHHTQVLEGHNSPPSAFTEYRTYDKVDVTSADDQAKRKFTEMEDNDASNSVTQKSFADATPSGADREPELGSKRVCSESQGVPNKRWFTEGKTDPPSIEQAQSGIWESLAPSMVIKPPDPVTGVFTPSALKEMKKEIIMPPPSLPRGLKGFHMSKPQSKGNSASEERDGDESKAPGLSLLAHYADDSDSDSDA